MAVFYVETSALVKRYRTEKGTDVVGDLFNRRAEDEVLVTSHLTTVELESVAARGLKARALNRTAYGVMLRAFADDLETMVVVPLSASLVSEAAQTARQHGLRALDALHLATALRVSRVAAALVLVASDRAIVQAGRAVGLDVLDPEAEGATEQMEHLRSGSIGGRGM